MNNYLPYNKLRKRTFLFKIGNYKTLGGAETQSLILAKFLKTNFDARIVFIADNDDGPVKELYQDHGFETYTFLFRLNGTPLYKIITSLKFIYFLRKFKPDFILPYSSDNCKKILSGWKYTGAAYAWWNMQDEGRFLYQTKHEERLLNSVSEIVSNSDIGSDFLKTNYHLKGKSIVKYRNPIEVPKLEDIELMWRKKFGIEDQAIVVCMIANLTKWKDHITLVKAWAYVHAHFTRIQKPCYLIFAGALKESTIDIKVLAYDHKLSDSLILTGSIKQTNALILESDLVVHSSNKEGVPNAICEAMALGKAVVATDIPGNREALTDRFENLTLSHPEHPEDLSEKIINLLEDAEKRREIGEYNKSCITQNYTQNQMIETFLESFIKYI